MGGHRVATVTVAGRALQLRLAKTEASSESLWRSQLRSSVLPRSPTIGWCRRVKRMHHSFELVPARHSRSVMPVNVKHMFSWKVLAIFVGIGPFIGAIGIGESFSDGLPFILVPIYMIGGIAAALAWAMYSIIFTVVHNAVTSHTRVARVLFGPFLIIWSAIIGGLCGLAAVASYSCANSWLSHPQNCVIDTLLRFWGISVLPGVLCGAFAAPHIERRRHNNAFKGDVAEATRP